MKKNFYILSFTFLGVLLNFLIHAILELIIIKLLVIDFDKYGLGLTWQQWFTIHYNGTIILLIAGIFFGFWQGKMWWRILYVEKRFNKVK